MLSFIAGICIGMLILCGFGSMLGAMLVRWEYMLCAIAAWTLAFAAMCAVVVIP